MPEDCPTIDCCLPLPDEYRISPDTDQFQLTLIADPVGGGEVSGGGTFDRFANVTIGSTPSLPVGQDVGVDIVFVVDESAIVAESKAIVTDIAASMEAELATLNIGNGAVANRYAVVAFGDGAPADEEIGFCASAAFITAVAGMPRGLGGALAEDAYEGINFAITQMPWRDEQFVSKVIFFITDEDRNEQVYNEGADQAAQFASLKEKIVDGEFLLAGFIPSVNAILRDEDNAVPCAADYTGKCYIADGSGGYTESAGLTNVSPANPWSTDATFPSGIKDEYFDLLMDTDIKGYFFELNVFNGYLAGGNAATSVLATIVPSLAPAIYETLLWNFTGWYDEFGVLFSSEESPTFTLTRNLALTGRFDFET